MKKLMMTILVSGLFASVALAGAASIGLVEKETVLNSTKANGVPVHQGGDTMGDAFLIPGIPFGACGTTDGYYDDYDEVCNYPGSLSPDVVYVYTPAANIYLNLSLCDDTPDCPTLYDTKLYIYDADMNVIACNDDACISVYGGQNYVSLLIDVPLTGGVTYYIIVDGYGSAQGQYFLNIVEGNTPPPPPDCPENTLFGQVPMGEGDPETGGYTSCVSIPWLVADNYIVENPICDIHWWGLSVDDIQPLPFQITFYYDLNGMPGEIACMYEAVVDPIPTGAFYFGYEMLYYSIDFLDPCCTLLEGWVSIQMLHPDFVWYWSNSHGFDHFCMQTDVHGYWPIYTYDYDTAFCLTGGGGGTTDIDTPQSLQLNQNYPNPFNPTTTIDYSLTQPEQVNLSVFNMTGELVATLVNGEVPVGNHSVTFNASTLPSGLYFYTLTAGNYTDTRKMVLIK